MSRNGHQPHVLCIDHAPEILDVLRRLLEDEGYRVSTSPVLDRSLESVVALQPDIITIDYMWDTADTGWTLLNLLRNDSRTRNIPVVLCTGAVNRAIETQDYLESIGVKVVLKPFDIEMLLDTLGESIAAVSTAREEIAS